MLTDARFKFALESLKKCILMEPKTDFFFSPHLLYQNLLVAYFGASDDIENSLREILCIPDHITKATLEEYYKKTGINQFCYTMNGLLHFYTCRIFSRLWISQSKSLKQRTWDLFSSAHQVIRMSNFEFRPNNVRLYINNSISSVTQHKIQNLLPPDSIDSDTDIVTANAIYLKGQLIRTSFMPVFITNPSGKTRTRRPLRTECFTNDKLKMNVYLTEVPLKQNEISVLFIRSSSLLSVREKIAENAEIEKQKIITLIELLTTEHVASRYLRKWLDSGLPHRCRLFSTFKIEHNLQMNELLKMLGVPELPPPKLSAFTDDGNLTLGSAVHRVSVEMRLNGITATASSAFFTINSTQEPATEQTTDIPADVHIPCICLIYDKFHRNILFCGVLWNIEQSEIVMI